MTEEEMEKMTVDDWKKLSESNTIQPRTIDPNKDVTDHEQKIGTGTVNLFED